MNPTGPRDVAKQQYANVRRSLTDFEERVVARYWDEDTPARMSFGRLLGSLDRFAGWLLDDAEISRRGKDLMRQGGYPASHAELESRGDLADKQEEQNDTRQARDEAGSPVIAEEATVNVTFTLPAEVQADIVALSGEFNQWSLGDIQLERGNDGVWRAVVALEPGRSYRYRYLLDGERWENAPDADQYVPNPFGSVDSVITVAPRTELASDIAGTLE